MNEIAKTFIVAGVVLKQDGKYLLVQEKQKRAYKQWNLPAGRVDLGETLEQAAAREAKEETGYDVEILEHLRVIHSSVESPVLHAFSAKIVGGSLQIPEDEMLDASWFTLEQAEKLDLRNPDYILGALRLVK